MNPIIRKINSITKYPSILTYHEIVGKGQLVQSLTLPRPSAGSFFVYEKVDGENARIVFIRKPNGEYDYFIGAREDFLYAKDDRLTIPTGNIAEFLKPLAEKLARQLAKEDNKEVALLVIYQESYGWKTPKAKQYTQTATQGYRFFDGFSMDFAEFGRLISLPLEEIAMWRDRGHQPFFPELQKKAFATTYGLESAPCLATAYNLPTSIEETYEWLKQFSKTQVAIDGEAGKSEGVIVRNEDRSIIKKIRFEDYERTLRK